jgi:catechol 2,3-dioxygenase-like lactoylglutathione lyase family enzyme
MPATTVADVLFDEAHSEAWTIRPELAAQMQPAHPADSCYSRAASALTERDFVVHANAYAPLTAETLAGHDVLVIAHPSEPTWERTTGSGSPRLVAEELDAIEEFVRRGGGLIVMGETEQEKYGNNLNELLARFGIHLENETVQDYEHYSGAPSWVLAQLVDGGRGSEGDLLARVHQACFYRATTVSTSNGARVLARSHNTASVPGAPLLVATEFGEGHVVVLGDSDLFGDDCIDELDHRSLWLNLVFWAARGADTGLEKPRAWREEPAWLALRDETNALALLQAADGALADPHDAGVAAKHVEAIATAIEELAPRFAHQTEYLKATINDLRKWVDSGFVKPDFTHSLELFRPELQREDGIEHLVLFPMYKQNGSRDTCFEALIVRVPWPDWIAELERTHYDNPKFVPVELLDATRGYDSECAVLFPETVSVAGRPVNNFGAIFCDREAERLRRIAGAAADLLKLNLPPDAATLLRSPSISQQAYILWDLIHDRAHSHGDLPFDPFMIRQRAPYWMYSLEELRCDLTAFTQAMALEADGVTFARYVQYAILLDRLIRFPITGARVRNYDGLGGQLLFAYLHRHGYLHWTDNQLTIEWERVADGVSALHAELGELYRMGIDRTKLQHWAAAHDLVAANVAPAIGSKWSAHVRDFKDVEDPRPYIDLVLEDEFPLSLFYSSLKAKLAI